MTPEAEFLLATLRNTNAVAPPSIDWKALLQLAESHGLFMWICHNYYNGLPEEFAFRARSQWAASAHLASELKALLQQFSKRDIEVISLKGPLLASLLYGSPSCRTSDDLDLLVQRDHRGDAEDLLEEMGFRSDYQPDDYHHAFVRKRTLVELHFEIAPPSNPSIDLPTAWARALTVEFQGQEAKFFAPPDLLLYLVIHLVKHDFGRLIWLLDTSLALKQLKSEETNEVLAMARKIGIEGAFLTTCALIESVFQYPLPQPIAAEIARKQPIKAQAEAILQRIFETPADPGTAHQGAQTFIQLESGAHARWAQRLRVLRPSQQDYIWAESHHLHPRWMMILRPLRLLTKHGLGAAWRVIFPRSGASTLRA